MGGGEICGVICYLKYLEYGIVNIEIINGGQLMQFKKYAVVDMNRCTACGECKRECPMGAVEMFAGCYARIRTTDCIGCALCAVICPRECIDIKER